MVTDKGEVAISDSRSLVYNRDFVLRVVRQVQMLRRPWHHIGLSRPFRWCSFLDHGPFEFVYRLRICGLLALWVLP